MTSRTTILRTLVAAALVAPLLAAASGRDTFANGQSFYGQPGDTGMSARVVDTNTAKYINVNYGETVTFMSGNRRFAWTFNGLDHRVVNLQKIAPGDFGGSAVVYVSPNPLLRN